MPTENLSDSNTLNNAAAQPAYDPMELPPGAPDWAKGALTKRQWAEVRFAYVYCNEFGHGTDGHSRLELICVLADILDDHERREDEMQAAQNLQAAQLEAAKDAYAYEMREMTRVVQALSLLCGMSEENARFLIVGYSPGTMWKVATQRVMRIRRYDETTARAVLLSAVDALRYAEKKMAQSNPTT